MKFHTSTKQKKKTRKVRSFAGRLTRWIILVMLVAMGLVSYLIYEASTSLVEEMGQMHNESLLDTAVENVRRATSDVYVGSVNHVPEIEESLNQPDRLSLLLERVVRQNPRIHSCGLCFVDNYYPQKGHRFFPYAVRRDNDTIEIKNIDGAQFDNLKTLWFSEVKEAKKAEGVKESHWSKPFFEDNDTVTPLVSYLLPIHDKQGKMVAVLGANLALEWLRQKTEDLSIDIFQKEWMGSANDTDDDETLTAEEKKARQKKIDERFKPYSFIITGDGTYLTHPDQKRILHENFFSSAGIVPDSIAAIIGREMTAGNKGYYMDADSIILSVDIEGRSSYVFYAPIKRTDWSMALVVPTLNLKLMAIVVGVVLLVLIAIGVIAVYLISRFTIRRIARPLKQLAYSADEVANGNFNTPLPKIKHNDEIHLLRDSFEGMQQSLTKYIDELKATTASKAAIENELRVAHDIQMAMLPKIFPPYPDRNDISLYGSLKPAKDVGGDLFDFYIRDNHLFFCIGEVSGKGIPASLVMAVTRSLFRNISGHTAEPDQIVSTLNKSLTDGNEKNMFVTMFVGVLHLDNGVLQYCNAGHDAPLLIGRGVGMLPCDPNLPIGVMAEWQFSLQETLIDSQTTIFLYTDGLNEAEDIHHAQFGNEHVITLAETLLKEDRNQPKIIVDSMVQAVRAFVGEAEQSDDLTMLAIKYTNTHGRQEKQQ